MSTSHRRSSYLRKTMAASGARHCFACALIRAESPDAAAKIFENHPRFTILSGDAVEVMECLLLPER